MLMFMPPALPPRSTLTPSTSATASARLWKGLLSSCSRVMTEIEAGAFLISCSNPEAVTTTVSICVMPRVSSCGLAVWAWAAPSAAIARASGAWRRIGRRLDACVECCAPPER